MFDERNFSEAPQLKVEGYEHDELPDPERVSGNDVLETMNARARVLADLGIENFGKVSPEAMRSMVESYKQEAFLKRKALENIIEEVSA